jgi:uncharacterized protein (TIGR00255 family)
LDDAQQEQAWQAVEPAVTAALDQLVKMRRSEGASMAADLLENCRVMEQVLEQVAQRAPHVVDEYARRLTERLNQMLAGVPAVVQPADIVREVGLHADRCDVAEEITRMRSHLEQFRRAVDEPAGDGRKLDFVTQEMLREANTIGSKSNDAEIARHVVELKTRIDRIREMVQNVE